MSLLDFDANCLWAGLTHNPYLDNGACTRLTVDIFILAYSKNIVNIPFIFLIPP